MSFIFGLLMLIALVGGVWFVVDKFKKPCGCHE